MRMAVHLALVAMLTAGCAGPGPGPTGTPSGAVCPDGSTLTYDTFGRSFVERYCTRCHASTILGAARNRAPVGVDFDTLAGIQESADRIDSQAASGPSHHNAFMPPSEPFPTTAERTDLGVWLACGAP
jgi:uncharacterized membrane protein